MTGQPIVLDPDIYDTLELVSEAYGGFAPGSLFTSRADGEGPQCVLGALVFAEAPGFDLDAVYDESGSTVLLAGRDYDGWDDVLRKLGGKMWPEIRVPFAEIVKELNIVRGDR